MTELNITDWQAYLANRYAGGQEQSLFMKLVEEMGEVAEVLNQKAGRKATEVEDLQKELGLELVDVIHYAVAIAAVNNLNLNQLIFEKDERASVKYGHTMNLTKFLAKK
ncbi:nucleotide pyrophosphohydrolase [Streptococcus sp. X16XC17]|uniref:MazG nucleotide pyrophosphohydrolase domain-containing protein n=1 Tax=unclassified Streptococcus TaxID=2608887 RepID=UPI00066FCCCF|nr:MULTISPECIES: MazG nucleotide pyrophosphohydrolase domain-containing protein [unclassified Streptococcus]TCD46278.1 nucleotide pyrophosphohydrolase [Streptococcus sp. X16XC17]